MRQNEKAVYHNRNVKIPRHNILMRERRRIVFELI